MIKLNHTRIRQSLENVLSELDAFDAQFSKPTFTAFILDVDRLAEDPFTVHFSASVHSECPEAVEAAYFEAHNKGRDEPDFEGSTAGEFWNFKGACVIGVIAGELSVIWNPDGCGFDEYEAAFKGCQFVESVNNAILDNVKIGYDLAELESRASAHWLGLSWQAVRDAIGDKKVAVQIPVKLEEQFRSGEKLVFPQTEKAVIINTSHISFGNLITLNGLMEFDKLPWWIVSTDYGYIIRFEAAVNVWEEENNIVTPDLMHPFKAVGLDDTFSALCATIAENGFDVIHLDRDAAEVAGLHIYEQEMGAS